MGDKELYQQGLQAQLGLRIKDVEKFKSLPARVSAEARAAMMANIVALEEKIAESNAKLGELAGASDEARASMKSAFSDAAVKFKA